jgi:hypothetical protein
VPEVYSVRKNSRRELYIHANSKEKIPANRAITGRIIARAFIFARNQANYVCYLSAPSEPDTYRKSFGDFRQNAVSDLAIAANDDLAGRPRING